MAQDSLYWDGTTTGDAASTDVWSAPYSSLEFADFFKKFLGSDAARGYVIPGYGSNLRVQANSPAAMNVLVGTGAASVRGKLYENTVQSTVTISAADGANPRIDRIVLQITFASQTVRLAVVEGTPAATPSLPALTQNATTYEVSLAYIWVAAAVASIAEAEIHDERVFAPNLEGLLTTLLQPNLLVNSEFMAFSRLNTVSASAGAPDRWTLVGTVTTWASATKPSQMSRGRAVQITAGGASAGMSQIVRVKASTVYSIRTLVNVTAGDVGIVSVTDNGGTPATITRNIRRTGSFIEETIYYTTPADATTLTVSLLGNANTDVVQFGQTLVVEGYLPGPFRQIHETILTDHTIHDSNWTADTKSTSTTVIDLDTDYEGLILPGTQGLYIYVQVSDSGSSGTVASLGVRTTGASLNHFVAIATTETNNTVRSQSGWVAPSQVDRQISFDVIASGAGTLTATVRIVGIVT